MRSIFFLTLLLLSPTVQAQWVKQTVNTTASFRGLSVVSEKVIWASGTAGTVIKTLDGGKTWKVMQVPEAGKLDFRDIEAFDAKTAYILSIGNGDSSRIYKTTDGGKTWNLQFKNTNEKAFFDALACWDKNNCIAMGDPVDNKFVLIETKNGGANWRPADTSKMPAAKDGEAAFAASGTCLITLGKYTAFLVSGGSDARVFTTTDRARSWKVSDTPMVKGTAGSGIFSIAMFDAKNGVIVGGNYEKPGELMPNNYAITEDGGGQWQLQTREFGSLYGRTRTTDTRLWGYRSGVAFVDKKVVIAVGTNGSDISLDGGKTWRALGKEDLNTISAKDNRAVWAVGPKGIVLHFADLPALIKTL